MSLVFGGLLPIIAFTVIEEYYGPFYGLMAALVFGLGELTFEKIKYNKISGVTWMGNGLIIGLGLVSIFTQDGIWFKLQPAILEAAFASMLWITHGLGKPMLVELSKKQNPELPEHVAAGVGLVFLKGVNFRCGIFFFIHAALATWAALKWSTQAWAVLKGLGVTLSFVLYMVIEVLIFRFRLKKKLSKLKD